jgi:cytochrome b subunit of formate dehydrogenase
MSERDAGYAPTATNGLFVAVSLKDRIKAAIKHKHDWKQDQWGKRCQSCGRVKTNKMESRQKYGRKVLRVGCTLASIAMVISGIIILIMYPIHSSDFRRMNSLTWLLLFNLGAILILHYPDMIHEGDESR